MRVRLHHEGRNILVVSFMSLLAINIFVWLFLRVAPAVPITVTVLSAIIFLFFVNFFRSPKRNFIGDRKNVVVASADGTVVALEEVYEDEYLHQNVIQLSIFMTILNVHANWFPVDGEVIYTAHHNGRFLSAYLPKSSTENERSTVVIRANNGQEVLMRQVAGAIARRIVTYAQPGVEASIEDHMGFIKFGSRIDLYLPLGTEILVKIGDKTTGGVTPVARLQSTDDKC